MSRSTPAPTWSVSCSSRRRRGTSRRSRPHSRASRSRPCAESRADSRCRRRAIRGHRREPASRTCCRFTARKRRARLSALRSRFGLPVMKAIPVETKSDLDAVKAMKRSPTGCCSMRALRATQRVRADWARASTGGFWKTSISIFRSCCRVGLMPAMSPKRCGSRARRVSTFRPESSGHRDRRTLTKFAASFARPVKRQRWPAWRK